MLEPDKCIGISIIALILVSCTTAFPSAECAWNSTTIDKRCIESGWEGKYPDCSIFQYNNHTPIPCEGNTTADYCDFDGGSSSSRPRPASYHVHIFFPNPRSCTSVFESEAWAIILRNVINLDI